MTARHAARAFGQYLEHLRERRGFSIRKVARLSARSPQRIDKASLCRLEQGRQQPSLNALSPLSRIYDASANVLIERLELEMELERIGSPDTEGKDGAELCRLGHAALRRNRRWEAYGYFGDAVSLTSGRRQDVSRMYLASVGRSIGKNHFAQYELEDLLARGDVGPERAPIVLERLAHCYRCTGRPARAEEHADMALVQARAAGQHRVMALAHSAWAALAVDQGEYRPALEKLRLAYKTYREAEGDREVIDAGAAFDVALLLSFADVYRALGQTGRAKRAALAARRIGHAEGVTLGVVYGCLILGVLFDQEGCGDQALRCWSEAARSATRIHHTKARFAAELYVHRHAVAHRLSGRAAAAGRRLERLAPWVPAHCRFYREWSAREPAATGGMTDAPEPIEATPQ